VTAGQRILFASEAGWGHVTPLITIAGELTARGVKDIWFASIDGHKAAIEAISGGESVRFVSLGAGVPELDPENWSDETVRAITAGSPLRNYLAVQDLCYDHDLRHQEYLRALEIIDEVRPVLAVVDLSAFWAIDALIKRGVPYIVTFAGLISQMYPGRQPWSYPTPLSGLPRNMSPRQKVRNVTFRLGSLASAFSPKHLRANMDFYRTRRAEGDPNPASIPSLYGDAAIAVLAYFVFGYEYPFPGIPDNLKMLGAILPRDIGTAETDQDLDRWLDEHESVVYASFGTVMRLNPRQIEAILDAAVRLGPEHHMLWKLPQSRRHLLPDRLPPNLRVESWVPSQFAVLAHPHVRAFFHHGGSNSVQEGLYFGKPELVMPFWTENLDHAARIIDSGAGLAVEDVRAADGRDIAAKLARLLGEPRFRFQAADWSRRLREAGGLDAAAEEIIGALNKFGSADPS
jgi:polyene glycosyltransferase